MKYTSSFAIETEYIDSFLALYSIIYGEDLKDKIDKIDYIDDRWKIIRGTSKKKYNKMDGVRRYVIKTGLKVKL